MSGPCIVCRAPNSGFGFRWPGPRKDIPDGKRGYLWACAEHREDGERRMRAAIDRHLGRAPKDQPTTPTNDTQQKELAI